MIFWVKYFKSVVYVCGGVYWNAAPGMDGRRANSYPDSLKLETNKKSGFKGTRLRVSTHHLNLYWRGFWAVQYNQGESLYGWGKSKADIWCCRQLEKPTPGWQAEPKGWSLISKFAQNNQHSIRGAVGRKSGWKLDFWYEKHTSKSIQWLELKIQICPKPPTHYSESHLKQVKLLNGWKGSSMRCSRFPCCF